MHTHDWPYEDPSKQKCTDIGPICCLRRVNRIILEEGGGQRRELAGFIVAHERLEGGNRCEGVVNVDPTFGKQVWSMTGTLEGGDLSLSPSIVCTEHDYFHIYVRDGKATI